MKNPKAGYEDTKRIQKARHFHKTFAILTVLTTAQKRFAAANTAIFNAHDRMFSTSLAMRKKGHLPKSCP